MLTSIAAIAAHVCSSHAISALPPENEWISAPPAAQADAVASVPGEGWRHSVALYFFAAGLSGESTVKGVDADLDVRFSDIWDNLEAGGMLAYRAETERYAFTVDTVFMGLEAEKSNSLSSAKAEFDELVIEVDGCLRLSPEAELILGARYWGLDADVNIAGPGPGINASGSKEWVDPVIGARYVWPFAEQWSLTVRGDIGGFGVGSDFSWQAAARVSWYMSESTEFSLGFRVIEVDYEDGSGLDEFRYDVLTAGVLGGVVFSF